MWWNKKESEEGIPTLVYNIPAPRHSLFPKLERLIRQAESHYDSGDKELCYEILDLIWRTVDKSKEEPVLKYDLTQEEKPEFPEDRNRIIIKAKD